MSEQFTTFDENNYNTELSSDILEDGIVWDQEPTEEQLTIHYSNEGNSPLVNNNSDEYMTADEEDNTHYFSVLENCDEVILNEINLDEQMLNTEERVVYEMPNDQNEGDITGGANTIFYKVDDSQDLFAIEIVYEDDGSFRKYKYRLSPNEKGDYVTVPNSLEILPDENIFDDTDPTQHVLSGLRNEVNIKHEPLQSEELSSEVNSMEDSNDQLQVNEDEETLTYEDENGEIDDELMDNKEGIIHFEEVSQHVMYKNEPDFSEESAGSSSHSLTYFSENPADQVEDNSEKLNIVPENDTELYEQVYIQDNNHYSIKSARHNTFSAILKHQNNKQSMKMEANKLNDEHIDEAETVAIVTNTQSSVENNSENNSNSVKSFENYLDGWSANESDTDDYQIVEGVHITGDTDINTLGEDKFLGNDGVRDTTSKGNIEQIQPHILQLHQSRNKNQNLFNDIKDGNSNKTNKNYTYLIIQHSEKENVSDISQVATNKLNPRSLLKTSYVIEEKKKPAEKTERILLKNKVAIQAKQLQNILMKPTILHAPIRQERLPRKQTITPVTRPDEEIVVKEVVVSSKGFIEASESVLSRSRNMLKATVVHVSDSDDETFSKNDKQRKKHKRIKQPQEIVISDTDEETLSSTENIDLSNDSNGNPRTNDENLRQKNNVKHNAVASEGKLKKRKNSVSGSNKVTRINLLDSSKAALETGTKLKSIKCPKCSNTFPSEGSLKTHMKFHNYELNKRLRSSSGALSFNVAKAVTHKNDNHHKCSVCNETFKNDVLLTKHVKTHPISTSVQCAICKSKFPDHSKLVAHKKTHLKDQMFMSSVPLQSSPKLQRVLKKFKSPSKGTFKCQYCSKIVNSVELLNNHMKTHKFFLCQTCGLKFLSHLNLQTHLRTDCVKSKTPQAKRDYLIVGASCVPKITPTKLFKSPAQNTSKRDVLRSAKKGDQQASHLSTPINNSIIKNSKQTVKDGSVGAPANKRLQNVFLNLARDLENS